MACKVLLDSGPLGEITHPRAERRRPIRDWLFGLLEAGAYPCLPEIVDYEHRRKLLHLESAGGVNRLDEFKRVFGYEPLTTDVVLRAARLWDDARKQGMPTDAEGALDVNVVLAAQALELAEEDERVVVATTNTRHLARFVDARDRQEIEP